MVEGAGGSVDAALHLPASVAFSLKLAVPAGVTFVGTNVSVALNTSTCTGFSTGCARTDASNLLLTVEWFGNATVDGLLEVRNIASTTASLFELTGLIDTASLHVCVRRRCIQNLTRSFFFFVCLLQVLHNSSSATEIKRTVQLLATECITICNASVSCGECSAQPECFWCTST